APSNQFSAGRRDVTVAGLIGSASGSFTRKVLRAFWRKCAHLRMPTLECSQHHRCPSSMMSSNDAGQFRVIGPRHPILALVGDEVELPCRISPGKNATGMEVGWYRPPFSRVVHLYRNGKDQEGEQAPEYRGRTELLKDTIGEGKVILKIRNLRFSDEGGFICSFRDHSYQEEAAMELKVGDPFYWINPAVLVLLAVLPVLLLQITVGLVYLCLQHRLRGKLRAEIENLHRTFDPHFLRVPCWKIGLFVIVPVLGPLVALIICYNWLHRRLAGQFLEELSKFSFYYKLEGGVRTAQEKGVHG
ncbi:Myelin-oligodendrocyte glycoprotein, partial [Galemys pyrenaicus]